MKNIRRTAFLFCILLPAYALNAYDIVCVGSPCLDILLQVDEKKLQAIAPEKGGSRPIDYLTFTNILRYSGAKPKVTLGGSATNVVRALAHLGEECALVGRVGSDEAQTIFRDLKKIDVDPLLLGSATPTTRVCCLVTPDGQRTMRVFLGASTEELPINDIRFDSFEKTKLVHIEGYLLYIKDGEFVRKVAEKAKEKGAKVSLDCASYEVVAHYKELIWELLRQKKIDLVFANEDEIQILTGFNPQHGCKELQKYCEVAIVTVGAKGCWIAHNNQLFHSPALPARVVDTTGAGDFFEAGFLHGYVRGKDIATCAQYGILLGKNAVEVLGTSLTQATWQRLKMETT